ncbi:MAG: hypothetical protein IT342_03120 [Candidatus Melainabacteria bacterium]|nr:hypothetical protein [Candidatus Melainabacteria bacterium]
MIHRQYAPPSKAMVASHTSNSSDVKSVPVNMQDQPLLKEIGNLQRELELTREKSKYIARELDLFRQRRAINWSDRFRNTFDAWNLMNKGFQQLKDDTLLFFSGQNSFRLQPSISLLRVPYVSYQVELKRKNFSGLLLAPVAEVPLVNGEICLQIMGEAQNLLVQCALPITVIRDDAPTVFTFPPIAESDRQKLTLKVFVQGVDAPVRVFEMRRYRLSGFGRLETRSFAGFIFSG